MGGGWGQKCRKWCSGRGGRGRAGDPWAPGVSSIACVRANAACSWAGASAGDAARGMKSTTCQDRRLPGSDRPQADRFWCPSPSCHRLAQSPQGVGGGAELQWGRTPPPPPAGQLRCCLMRPAAPGRPPGGRGGGRPLPPGVAGSLCVHVAMRAPCEGAGRAPSRCSPHLWARCSGLSGACSVDAGRPPPPPPSGDGSRAGNPPPHLPLGGSTTAAGGFGSISGALMAGGGVGNTPPPVAGQPPPLVSQVRAIGEVRADAWAVQAVQGTPHGAQHHDARAATHGAQHRTSHRAHAPQAQAPHSTSHSAQHPGRHSGRKATLLSTTRPPGVPDAPALASPGGTAQPSLEHGWASSEET